MDKEKELRKYNNMIINDKLDYIIKQNENLESLNNRNTGMILKRLERIQKQNHIILSYVLPFIVGLLIAILFK
ncbi:hypothetical protein FYN01_03550 [Lactobacillus salivarius]|uniref:Uncharacterized protein n=1 Tax=Ligilactobacillus salivarius TaxID=1624 RepID=A0A1Y0F895_9LACO|nr:hypothetical protein [Ligilactobacillus salivarius]ARU19393.1 hypothetical protein B7R82_05080 [Ligilactobacillus salivarius]MYV03116.1 hypothetical protein [Ligilactobacillus salivarius]